MSRLNRGAVSFCVILLICSASLYAQTSPVVVGVGGLAGNLIHPFVSRDAGLFQKYGVDARLVLFEGGTVLTQAAMSGEVKISIAAGTATIASRSQGADSIIVSSYMNTLDYSLVAAKGITHWQQLKGKRIAISRFGSSTDTAVRLVLEKLGFVREGTLREDCVVNGEVSDSWVYGLIRREWRPSSEPVPAR